jgi:hypothetical protein
MKFLLGCLGTTVLLCAQSVPLDFLNHNRPVLDAHNCYPYDGQWSDRIDRALKTGFPVGIEQDIAWASDPATGKGRPVVTHTPKTTGAEPTLRDHFFERVRPTSSANIGTGSQPRRRRPTHTTSRPSIPSRCWFLPKTPTNRSRCSSAICRKASA